MIKTALLLISAIVMLGASQAFAVNDHASSQGKDNSSFGQDVSSEAKDSHSQSASDDANDTEEIEVDDLNEQEECDAEGEWKNHGEYVSCVAHQKLGGQVVSEAAKSDIGKKDSDNDDVLPTVTPTPTETLTPTPTPTPTITQEVAEASEESDNDQNGGVLSQIQGLLETISEFVNTIQSLLPFVN